MKRATFASITAAAVGVAVFSVALAVCGTAAAQAPNVTWIGGHSGAPAVTTAPDGTTFTLHGYAPSDIYAAYGVDALHADGLEGQGQTIVIVDSYGSPTALHDLQVFSQDFNLPAPDLTIIYPDGTPTFNKAMHGTQSGWAVETSLDLQWAHAIAPLAKLVLIAANPAETEGVQGFPSMFKGIQFAIDHYPGSPISQSFAVTEQSFHSAADAVVSRFDKVYRQAVAARCTVLSASGDSGTANIDKQGRLFPFPTALWPASDPLVTAVGGTWLQYGWQWDPLISAADFFQGLNSGGDPGILLDEILNDITPAGRTEAVWREDWLPAATGGGLSALFATPTFQSSISSTLLLGRRGVPDLAWNAAVDGGVLVQVSFLGGYFIIGGTSAAAPQTAAVIALANQLRSQLGKQPIGYLNPILYSLPASDFTDIVPVTFGSGSGVTTVDSNTQFGSGIAGFSTTPGWDLTTGFGSPKAYQFVHDLGEAP